MYGFWTEKSWKNNICHFNHIPVYAEFLFCPSVMFNLSPSSDFDLVSHLRQQGDSQQQKEQKVMGNLWVTLFLFASLLISQRKET